MFSAGIQLFGLTTTTHGKSDLRNLYFEVRFTMLSGFQAKKLNIHREYEFEIAAKWAEPKKRAELVPGPHPNQIRNFKIFPQKIKSTTLLV